MSSAREQFFGEAPGRLGSVLDARAAALVVALTLVAVGWRLVGWGQHWLNPDEGTYYAMATWPAWSEFWAELGANAHPPLFYLLERLLGRFTASVSWLRVPALLCGGLAVVGFFLAVRRLADASTACCGAVLVAFSPALVVHSQLIRPYTMQLALLAFGLWLFLRYLDGQRRADLAGAAGLWILALLTHYASVVPVVACAALAGAELATRRLPAREIPVLGIAFAAVAGSGILLLALHLDRHVIGSPLETLARVQLARLLHDDLAGVGRGLIGVHLYLFGPRLAACAILLSAVGLLTAMARRDLRLPVLAFASLSLASGLSLAHGYPLGASRHSLYLAIVIVPSIALALRAILSMRPIRGLLVGSFLALLVAAPAPLQREFGIEAQMIPLETPVTTEAARRQGELLERARREATVIFFDRESYFVLMPFLRELGERVPPSLDAGLSHFSWGNSELLVAHGWRLLTNPGLLSHPQHVVGFQRYANAALPELHLSAEHTGWLLFAGWGAHLPVPLRALNRRLGGAAPCFTRARFEGGMGSVRVDFARCLEGLQSLNADRPTLVPAPGPAY